LAGFTEVLVEVPHELNVGPKLLGLPALDLVVAVAARGVHHQHEFHRRTLLDPVLMCPRTQTLALRDRASASPSSPSSRALTSPYPCPRAFCRAVSGRFARTRRICR